VTAGTATSRFSDASTVGYNRIEGNVGGPLTVVATHVLSLHDTGRGSSPATAAVRREDPRVSARRNRYDGHPGRQPPVGCHRCERGECCAARSTVNSTSGPYQARVSSGASLASLDAARRRDPAAPVPGLVCVGARRLHGTTDVDCRGDRELATADRPVARRSADAGRESLTRPAPRHDGAPRLDGGACDPRSGASASPSSDCGLRAPTCWASP